MISVWHYGCSCIRKVAGLHIISLLDSLKAFHAQLVVTAIEWLKVDHTALWENKCWPHCLLVSSMALLQQLVTGQISCQSRSRLNHVQNASPSAKHVKTLELLKNSCALAFGRINQDGGAQHDKSGLLAQI